MSKPEIVKPEIVKLSDFVLSDTAQRSSIKTLLFNLKEGEGLKMPINKRSGLYNYTKKVDGASEYQIKYCEDKKNLVIFKATKDAVVVPKKK